MQFRKRQLASLKDLETVIFALVVDQKDPDLIGIVGAEFDRPDAGKQSLRRVVDRNDDGDLRINLWLIQTMPRLGPANQQQKKTADRRYDLHQDRDDDPRAPEYEGM